MTAEGGEVGSPAGAPPSSRCGWMEKFSSKKSGGIIGSKFAYVTLLTTDSFVPGVEVMIASLKEKIPKQQEEGRPGKPYHFVSYSKKENEKNAKKIRRKKGKEIFLTHYCMSIILTAILLYIYYALAYKPDALSTYMRPIYLFAV